MTSSATTTSPGATVDRYVLGASLGRGGMGLVFEAWDPLLKRTVALKVLSGGNPELQHRLLQEAQAQARLRHPHICPVYDSGTSPQGPYIAMQRLHGDTLGDLRPSLTPEEVARILADVAGAMHAAHRAGLLHRDLKPSNILVERREDGALHPYIVDFGLAKDMTLGDDTLSWAVMGTPAFMSPEQARGEALTPASDLFSLGATLYAMFSGQPPYEGTTLAQLITRHATTSVPRFRTLRAAVPKDLETIVLKCLEIEPERRYTTAHALEEDLRRFLAGEPLHARRVGPAGRLLRWIRRNPRLAVTLASSLTVISALGAWNLHTLRQARLREQAAQRFGMDIRDAEHLLRIERMLPAHDIRSAEARLRARMEAIAQEMHRLGTVARGPGRYALGRGQLALREHAKAVRTLEGAWEAGYRAPEVAHAIAQAMMMRMLDESILWNLYSDQKYEEKIRQVLAPAHRWMAQAAGARVDHPEYTLGMLAMWERRQADAERHFAQAFAVAPWLYEALLGTVHTRILAFNLRAKTPEGAPPFQQQLSELDGLLARAQALAGSDPEVRIQRAKLRIQRFIRRQAAGQDVDEPSAEAAPFVEAALAIQPDSLPILEVRLHLIYQRAWEALQRGADPGAALRLQLQGHAPDSLERMTGTEAERTTAMHMLHNAWWAVAELDWRHGRDPMLALRQAQACSELSGQRDHQRLVALLLEAKYRLSRGETAPTCAREAEGLARDLLQAYGSAWVASLSAELQLELARARPAETESRLAQAIRQLERAVQDFPKEVFAWALLPTAHARMARWCQDNQRDPGPSIARAQTAARRAMEAFPGHFRIHLASAEVCTTQALLRMEKGHDPGAALEAARRALEASGGRKGRFFETCLLRAEVEYTAATHAQATGGDPEHFRRIALEVCQRGLGIKWDEPRLRRMLAQLREALP